MKSHAAVAAILLEDRDLVDGVLADPATAPASEADRAIYRYAAKVGATRGQIEVADVEEVLAAGWSQDAVYDVNTVVALFQFFNTWVDSHGVPDMPAHAYEAAAQRMVRPD